jgi:hypothetical protein
VAELVLRGRSLGGVQYAPAWKRVREYKCPLGVYGPKGWVPEPAQRVEANCDPPCCGQVTKVDAKRRIAWVATDNEGEHCFGLDELRPERPKRG